MGPADGDKSKARYAMSTSEGLFCFKDRDLLVEIE